MVGQVVRSNPASVVRGPKHVIKRGKTPVLSPEEARELFNGIPSDTLIGLRDRALIGVLIYSLARVSIVLLCLQLAPALLCPALARIMHIRHRNRLLCVEHAGHALHHMEHATKNSR